MSLKFLTLFFHLSTLRLAPNLSLRKANQVESSTTVDSRSGDSGFSEIDERSQVIFEILDHTIDRLREGCRRVEQDSSFARLSNSLDGLGVGPAPAPSSGQAGNTSSSSRQSPDPLAVSNQPAAAASSPQESPSEDIPTCAICLQPLLAQIPGDFRTSLKKLSVTLPCPGAGSSPHSFHLGCLSDFFLHHDESSRVMGLPLSGSGMGSPTVPNIPTVLTAALNQQQIPQSEWESEPHPFARRCPICRCDCTEYFLGCGILDLVGTKLGAVDIDNLVTSQDLESQQLQQESLSLQEQNPSLVQEPAQNLLEQNLLSNLSLLSPPGSGSPAPFPSPVTEHAEILGSTSRSKSDVRLMHLVFRFCASSSTSQSQSSSSETPLSSGSSQVVYPPGSWSSPSDFPSQQGVEHEIQNTTTDFPPLLTQYSEPTGAQQTQQQVLLQQLQYLDDLEPQYYQQVLDSEASADSRAWRALSDLVNDGSGLDSLSTLQEVAQMENPISQITSPELLAQLEEALEILKSTAGQVQGNVRRQLLAIQGPLNSMSQAEYQQSQLLQAQQQRQQYVDLINENFQRRQQQQSRIAEPVAVQGVQQHLSNPSETASQGVIFGTNRAGNRLSGSLMAGQYQSQYGSPLSQHSHLEYYYQPQNSTSSSADSVQTSSSGSNQFQQQQYQQTRISLLRRDESSMSMASSEPFYYDIDTVTSRLTRTSLNLNPARGVLSQTQQQQQQLQQQQPIPAAVSTSTRLNLRNRATPTSPRFTTTAVTSLSSGILPSPRNFLRPGLRRPQMQPVNSARGSGSAGGSGGGRRATLPARLA